MSSFWTDANFNFVFYQLFSLWHESNSMFVETNGKKLKYTILIIFVVYVHARFSLFLLVLSSCTYLFRTPPAGTETLALWTNRLAATTPMVYYIDAWRAQAGEREQRARTAHSQCQSVGEHAAADVSSRSPRRPTRVAAAASLHGPAGGRGRLAGRRPPPLLRPR